jgi:hypothetical protein
MGSTARDKNYDILVGYSVSSSSVYPSIAVAGRTLHDPLGTLENEIMIANGGGSQTGTYRWGDYSAMRIDPQNDCTFWYTTEYYVSSSPANWSTRIASATFSGCQ